MILCLVFPLDHGTVDPVRKLPSKLETFNSLKQDGSVSIEYTPDDVKNCIEIRKQIDTARNFKHGIEQAFHELFNEHCISEDKREIYKRLVFDPV